jgi:hypothetical protein
MQGTSAFTRGSTQFPISKKTLMALELVTQLRRYQLLLFTDIAQRR